MRVPQKTNEFLNVRKMILLIQFNNLRKVLLVLVMRLVPNFFLSRKEFEELLKKIKPIDNGFQLIRIGAANDGGYLVPDDLNGVSHCFSAGVADSWSFEKELFEMFKISSTMYDGSISRPKNLEPQFIFHRKFVGATTHHNFISINEILNFDLKNFKSNLIAQIDIEGSEYELLNTLSDKDFQRFRIIVIEFHNVDKWIEKKYFYKLVNPILEKISKTHLLVHSHENNFGGRLKFRGQRIPRVIELTFHNRSRAKYFGGYRNIPHPLDANNWQVI